MRLVSSNDRQLVTTASAGATVRAVTAVGQQGPQGLPGVGAAAWTAATAVTTGTVRQAPDGSWIKSKATRTTGASFDATEQAFWETTGATAGTFENARLSATIDAQVPVASTTARGKVELATTAEATTGTDAGRAVTPAALLGAATDTSGPVVGFQDARFAGIDTLAPIIRPKRANYTVITTFQAGHGWTDQGGTSGGSVADDTSVIMLGSQSLKIITPAVGGASRTVRKTGLTAVDLSAKNIALYLQVDAPTALGDMILTTGDDTFTNFTQWRAVYGNATADNATLRAGEAQWVHFTRAEVTNTTGTGGLAAVTAWQLRVNGGATSVITVNLGAVAYFDKATSFPNGVVSWSCDDSYASQLGLMAPALMQRGQKATAFHIVGQIGQPNRLTMTDLDTLHNRFGWENAGHALLAASHDSANGFLDLTQAQLEAEARGLRAFGARGGWQGADLIAWPKGKENQLVRQVFGQYFSFGRLVTRQPYQTARVEGRAMRARAYSVDLASTPASTLTALIDSAYTNGWWLIITLHDVKSSGSSLATEWDVSKVATVADYINTKGIPCRLIGDVLTAA